MSVAFIYKRMVETTLSQPNLSKTRKRGGGYAMVSFCISTVVLIGFGSLAVDYGHCKLIKTELQRCTDATAHDYMVLYNIGGQSYANTNGPASYSSTYNPVDTCAAVTPTVTVMWGYWNPSTQTFSASAVTNYPAVRVTASYTAANSNAIPLVFARIIGQATCDISVSSTAALMGGSANSANVNIPATANPYLSGMPAGTTTQFGDTTYANGAIQVTAIPVVPGTFITFTNFTGTTSVVPGTVPYVGPQGQSNMAVQHGQNYDGTEMSPGPENGIANAIMPEDSLMGLFLTNNAPDTTSPPPMVDWTQPSQLNQTSYTNLQVQAPFYIGTGSTSGGVTQTFQVPPGATEFYIGIWDGVDYNNNGGSLSGTITVKPYVSIVQ